MAEITQMSLVLFPQRQVALSDETVAHFDLERAPKRNDDHCFVIFIVFLFCSFVPEVSRTADARLFTTGDVGMS